MVAIRSESDEQLRDKKLERIAWQTPVAQPVLGPVTLAGDLVVAGAGNGDVVHSSRNAQGLVVALDRKTGEIRWQTPLDDAGAGNDRFSAGRIDLPLAERRGDGLGGQRRPGPVARPHQRQCAGLAGCAFTGRRVYAVSSDGYLAVIDFKTGKIVEKTYLNDQAKPGSGLTVSLPQVVGGRVLVGSETGGLHCLDGSEGAE